MPLTRTEPPVREGWIDPHKARQSLKNHLEKLSDEEVVRDLENWGLDVLVDHFGLRPSP